MTYCLAMRLETGLVFLSDTRTNAGVDNVSTYRKLHVIQPAPDRIFVIQSAGNLSTTQQVLDEMEQDLQAGSGDSQSLATVGHLFEAALYIGEKSRKVANKHREALQAVGADPTCSFILGGQIGSGAPDLLHIYPEGNYIRASDDLPFLQIGESKYGKFILEMGAVASVDLQRAVRVAISSMMSTARANVSVGPPYDLAVYRTGSFQVRGARIEAGDRYLDAAAEVWERHLLAAIGELPEVDFELEAVTPEA